MAKQKLGELFYDFDSETGEIKIKWDDMPDGVVGLDILSDWISDITYHYHRALGSVFEKGIKDE